MTYEEFLGVPELSLFQMSVIFDITNMESGKDVNDYINSYPYDLRPHVSVIAELMLLAHIDQVEDYTEAKEVLDKIFSI